MLAWGIGRHIKMFCVLLSGYFSNRCSSSCFYFCWFKISPMGLLNGPPISQASFLRCQANFICRYDGIGRHSRLKICLEQSSTGSSPVSGTTPSQISFDLRRFSILRKSRSRKQFNDGFRRCHFRRSRRFARYCHKLLLLSICVLFWVRFVVKRGAASIDSFKSF